jgi:hypothetical protein
MKYGIDVCSYQGRIDWKRVKNAGCSFAVLKCIRKDLNPDTAFARNVAGCTEQKFPVDVYTYVYEGDGKGARKRAEAAVKACQAQGLKGWFRSEDLAFGAETEDVLLLGETVVNKTVPLILCAEEDVKGSHGATIGQLDEEMLFYLGSRGISEEKAVDLMAGARIGRIIREIGDETAEQEAKAFLGIEEE